MDNEKTTMARMGSPENLWLCKICDLLIPRQPLSAGERVLCPECHHKVAEKNYCPLLVGLALAFTGLLLVIPGCLLPLIHMKIFSIVTDHSIVTGITSFARQGMWIPAILIFMGIIFIPLLYFTLTITLLSFITLNRYYAWLTVILRLQQQIRNWSMLEIYLLGIIIAMVKLGDFGKVYPDLGFFVFIGLFVCQSLLVLSIRPYVLWEKLELMQHGKNRKRVLSN